MGDLSTLFVIWTAFIGISFWESSVEGRNAWSKHKFGWKLKIGKYIITTRYHFFLFLFMVPLFLSLPLVINGWDFRLFGVLLTGYFMGLSIEDFGWYMFNPKVKLKEFWSSFSDYYPWVRLGKKKIIPVFYLVTIGLAILSWFFIWR